MRSAQNRVKLLMPVRSNDIRSTMPKLAQKSDCDVSNKLEEQKTSVVPQFSVACAAARLILPYLANLLHIEQAFS